MHLNKVQIKNFRSIADVEVNLDPTCRILVGINESGKSNILKALNLLSEEPISSDLRFALDGEDVKESFVRFVFTLHQEDQDSIYRNLLSETFSNNRNPIDIVSKSGKSYSLEDLCRCQNEGLYKADIQKEKRSGSYWKIQGYSLIKNTQWVKPVKSCPNTIVLLDNDGNSHQLNKFKLIDVNNVDYEDNHYIEEITIDDIYNFVGNAISTFVEENLPNCVYWTYSDQYLLPARVDLVKFKSDPDICTPLKNMFELAGEPNINEAFEKASENKHGERNLLDRVARYTTQHIKSIWKEYKSIEILLEPYGPDLVDASVKDKTNRYDFSNRSDGFKRFISFLLMISARVKTNNLQNTLILIDEPEIGLHPKGAKHLLDELLKISSENYVVFSTHSIFMIDRENVSRHYIVEKNDEITILKDVNESNFQDEEVIYNALGYSVFESLKEKNLIFEGWKDKHMFQVAISKPPAKYKTIKKQFENIGIAHLQGVKDFKRIVPILDLANRSFMILSDDDNAAKEAQKDFQSSNGSWKRYSEIITDKEGLITGEDFIKPDLFVSAITSLKATYPKLGVLTEADLINVGGKLVAINYWIKASGIDKETSTKIINQVKSYVSDNLKETDIEDSYYELLQKIVL